MDNVLTVTVSFTLRIDPAAWVTEGNHPDAPVRTDVDGETVITEVKQHAETVVRDLFWDMGWTVER